MNRKDLFNNLSEDREIQNRFTAYIQEAMKTPEVHTTLRK